MTRLYRMHPGLPSLPTLAGLVLLLAACEAEPPHTVSEGTPDAYLEKLQDAEAARYSIEQHELEQRELEQLLGRDQSAPVTR